MSRYRLPLLLLALACVSIAPLAASAAVADFVGSIIPNVGDDNGNLRTCAAGWGGLIVVLNNIIKFAIYLGIIVAVLTTAYGGFLLVLSPANPENRSKAKSLLINAAIGLVLALSAWLIVNTIVGALSGGAKSISSFTGILSGGDICQPVPTGGGGGVTTTPGTGTGGTRTPNCPTCVSLSTYGLTCKNNCSLNPSVASKIADLDKKFDGNWEVTEAWPPSQSHQNACHYNGTCIDAAFRGTAYTAENISAFSKAAKSSGLRPVFETVDCSLKAAAKAKDSTIEAYCKSDSGYGAITGNHFSVYGN